MVRPDVAESADARLWIGRRVSKASNDSSSNEHEVYNCACYVGGFWRSALQNLVILAFTKFPPMLAYKREWIAGNIP